MPADDTGGRSCSAYRPHTATADATRPIGSPPLPPPRATPLRRRAAPERWSQRVTEGSNALDLEPGVFTWDDPAAIARSLKASAEASRRRKTTPFRSAMSMLTFYVNRAGSQLDDARRERLEAAKDELRALYGRLRRQAGAVSR